MHFYFYKITNNINNKIYYGVHRTKNLKDGYMGSGTLLRMAQKKYGIEHFTKDIIETFYNCDDMFDMEEIVVNEEFIKRKDNYNIQIGGRTRITDFKTTEYFMSGKHIENANKARQLAAIATQKLKLQRREKYAPNPKLCKTCANPIEYEKKVNKFCSKSCSATFNNKRRIVSEAHKNNISNALKGRRLVSDKQLLTALKTTNNVKDAFKITGLIKNSCNYQRAKDLIIENKLTNITSNTHINIENKKNKRIRIILDSDIDFSKYGWVKLLSELLGISKNSAGKWVKYNMPAFYRTCYTRNNYQSVG